MKSNVRERVVGAGDDDEDVDMDDHGWVWRGCLFGPHRTTHDQTEGTCSATNNQPFWTSWTTDSTSSATLGILPHRADFRL